MIGKKIVAALFDFDGVVMDTETQYSKFWNEKGKIYFPDVNEFGKQIKGQTLTQICDRYFANDEEFKRRLIDDLNIFEENMSYQYIPGALSFMKELKNRGVKVAIVTSSNEIKMNVVYRVHPELKEIADYIFTAEMFSHSKPDPDCFLLGASHFNADVRECVVFEDSFHGLEAGRRAGMFVVGLATTNSAEDIRSKADYIIDNFEGFGYDKLVQLI